MNKLTKIINLQEITDEGILRIAEVGKHINFPINRFYIISDVINDAIRGKHAHHSNYQALFLLKGRITIMLTDGINKELTSLETAGTGILLEPMIWHEMSNFTPDTILLVVASEQFNEADYIRNFNEFSLLMERQNDNNE